MTSEDRGDAPPGAPLARVYSRDASDVAKAVATLAAESTPVKRAPKAVPMGTPPQRKELLVNGGESAPGSPKRPIRPRHRWGDDEDGDRASGPGSQDLANSSSSGAATGGVAGGGIITQYGLDEALAKRHDPEAQADDGQGTGWRSIMCCFSGAMRGLQRGGYSRTSASCDLVPGHRRVPLADFPLAVAPRNHPRPPVNHTAASLPPQDAEDVGKKTLVLDLDETLVHSSFKEVENADFIIPIEIEGRVNNCYVLKRPCVDAFIEAVTKMYEVVVFTASLSKYGDPLLDLLDPKGLMKYRLFRESCALFEGNFVKDLSSLGRDLKSTMIIDNSPHSYVFHPENAIPIGTYIDDPADTELADMLPYLSTLNDVDDVRDTLGQGLY